LAYKILFNTAVLKDLKRIDVLQQKRILAAIAKALTASPTKNSAPLKGKYKGFWKLYVIPYRVIYIIDEKNRTLFIEKIGHRKDVYR